MCSIRCKESKSKRCSCECGGLYHGIITRSHSETFKYLHRSFPPCTPVRLRKRSYRGTRNGSIKRFFGGKFLWYAVLRENNEVVSIDNLIVEKGKHKNEEKRIIRRRTDEPQMNLPEGYTCGDCFRYPSCKLSLNRNMEDERCDWFPSVFFPTGSPVYSILR